MTRKEALKEWLKCCLKQDELISSKPFKDKINECPNHKKINSYARVIKVSSLNELMIYFLSF